MSSTARRVKVIPTSKAPVPLEGGGGFLAEEGAVVEISTWWRRRAQYGEVRIEELPAAGAAKPAATGKRTKPKPATSEE